MAAHAPSIPATVAGNLNRAYLSSIAVLDRSYLKELVDKYGAQDYTFMLDLLGAKVKTENRSFYHYEKRKRMAAFQVASITGGGSAGVDVVITLAAGSHYDSGKKSPVRVGEVVQWANNGRMGKISAINTSVDGAHTATVKPLSSAVQINPALNDWMLCHGLQHVGEASDAQTSLQPLVDTVTNTVTEIREDYVLTDKAAMERIEFSVNGNHYFKYFGSTEAEKRWLNHREDLLMFSTDVSNTGITSNGTVGTKGAIQQIVAGGSTLSYSAGSLDGIVDFQKVSRELDFNGAATEVHGLMDTFMYEEIQRELFGQYANGAILWASAGGSSEVAAKLGFSSYAINGFTFHFKKYAGFQPEKKYGVSPSAYEYANYGLFIPQGFGTDAMGTRLPNISLRYQEIPGIGEINAYETGGLATTNKTPVQECRIVMIGHYGVQVQAANQCVILAA